MMICSLKRFFCLLAAVVLTFSCMGALAATPTAPPAEPEGLTTQIQALEDYLAKNSTTNGNGWKVYPEGFAGYYATDGGTKLTLCMTDASDPASQGLRSLAAQCGIPLKKGDSVSITGEDKGWWKIDFNGRMGYVSKKYVEVQP